MRPICLIYDGLKDSEKRIVIETLEKACKIFQHRRLMNLGRKIRLYGTEVTTSETIISRCKRIVKFGAYGPRYDAEDIWQQIYESDKMRKSPFVAVFVTTKDLTVKMDGSYLNFCFGYTRGPVAVISIARVKGQDEPIKRLMIEGLIMHELGHAFDLCLGGRSNTINNYGVHCANPGCVMQQGLSTKALQDVFKEAFKDYRRCYCKQCMEQAKLVYN